MEIKKMLSALCMENFLNNIIYLLFKEGKYFTNVKFPHIPKNSKIYKYNRI